MKISDESKFLWWKFLKNQDNLGHIDRGNDVQCIESHVISCWSSALVTAERIRLDIDPIKPKKVLEVGCSTGLICFAIKKFFPNSQVIGLEPEIEAYHVANSMSITNSDHEVKFLNGFGEKLPFEDNTFDLIICHTVIEHVKDVKKVMSEISRVLTVGGVVHLEAPNYTFPYEPHLQIYTFPFLGKKFVAASALLQGKSKYVNFLKHLNFVNPLEMEKIFKINKLSYFNRSHKKIELALNGEGGGVLKYTFARNILRFAGKMKLSKPFLWLIIKLDLYPSILYTLRKLQ
jgi:ubiquinone/menaquinone biosynthesis C-methylase UbiE